MTPIKRERINKLHCEIATRRDTATPAITFTDKERIYFNTGAVELCNLKIGNVVHFEKADKYWYFFVAKNDGIGFTLYKPDARQQSMCVSSRNLIALFNKHTGNSGKGKYYIQKTASEVQGNPLFEIITKPISK